MIDDATQKQLERGCFQAPKPPAKKTATFSNEKQSGSFISPGALYGHGDVRI